MFQRSLAVGQIAAMLSRAGIDWDQVADAALLDGGSEVRLALYRSYLYLIMLAEVTPRSFTPAERRRREVAVAPALATELNLLRDRLAR